MFFNPVAFMPFVAALTADASLSNVLSLATELLTWVVTSMGSVLTFIRSNPEIMIWFVVAIVGFAVGMLTRIWRSVG